jgi:predicted nucleic acid-binding protein
VIVVDAVAMVAALVDTDPRCHHAVEQLQRHSRWFAPAHMPIEVVRVFAKLHRLGLATEAAAEGLAMQMHTGIGAAVTLADGRDLIPAVWRLRHNISPYDGAYVALAELIGVPLLTGDQRLAKAATGIVDVILI